MFFIAYIYIYIIQWNYIYTFITQNGSLHKQKNVFYSVLPGGPCSWTVSVLPLACQFHLFGSGCLPLGLPSCFGTRTVEVLWRCILVLHPLQQCAAALCRTNDARVPGRTGTREAASPPILEEIESYASVQSAIQFSPASLWTFVEFCRRVS